MLLGNSAIGQFALGMIGDEVVIYKPISKIGASGSFNPNPIPVFTFNNPVGGDVITWNNETSILYNNNTEIEFNG
jgi:hypothetical protein